MEIPESHTLEIGDRIDMFYTIRGWAKRSKIDSLVHKVDQDPRWAIREYDYNEDKGKLRLRVEILQNPFPVAIVAVAVAVVGAGLFAWLSLDKVEKIVTDPVAGLSVLGMVGAGLLLLWRFK